jgi:hypothetical protein
MRRDAFALLLLGAASVGSYHWITVKPMTPPFHFRLAPSATRVRGSEVWEATAKPDGVMDDSIQTRFRLSLASPARSARAGTRIKATLRRSDKGGMRFFLALLGETFEPPGFEPRSSSGALMPIPISPADSVPLRLTVRDRESHEPWMALAELQNGGRFLLAIDSAAGWGEFRSVGAEYHMQVLSALVGLSARQQ